VIGLPPEIRKAKNGNNIYLDYSTCDTYSLGCMAYELFKLGIKYDIIDSKLIHIFISLIFFIWYSCKLRLEVQTLNLYQPFNLELTVVRHFIRGLQSAIFKYI
jgi:hypothetical protein